MVDGDDDECNGLTCMVCYGMIDEHDDECNGHDNECIIEYVYL